jgi:chemotaxis methyl-accepting protein methylase
VTDAVVELARLIEEMSGFVIPKRGHPLLAALARERTEALGAAGIDAYLRLLHAHPGSDEWRCLLGRITVKESRLFRARPQLDALARVLVPEIVAGRESGRLSVWSAGCARGEEAVTVAVVLADHRLLQGWQWSILATDVDESALADAEQGLYGPRATADVPSPVLDRHFEHRGEHFEVVPAIRRRIRYRYLNLAAPRVDLPEAPFDLIFLRNVLIYFRPEVQRRVVGSVERMLAPRGCLFLGPSESLLPLDAGLQPRDLGECFCYCWPPTVAATAALTGKVEERPKAPASGPEEPLESFERGGESADPGPRRSFEELAEEVIRELETTDREQGRRAASALRSCYPEYPMAHVLEGLAWLKSDRPERALLSFRAARYLAPDVAEVRYLVGQVLDELGRYERARREYRAALAASDRPAGTAWSALTRLGVPELEAVKTLCRRIIIRSQ